MEAATCIAKTAEALSFKKDYDSPFAVHARQAGRNHPGGKKDDITVIVAQVQIQKEVK
jgi:protein phosphatase PTC7